jgi:hypothetical protein
LKFLGGTQKNNVKILYKKRVAKMTEKEYEKFKNEDWYKEVIKHLRQEISELIKENALLKEQIIDLKIIEKKDFNNGKIKKR